jgi:hypothetical protein
LTFVVKVSQGGARAHPGGFRLWIDPNVIHWREVDHDPIVTDSVARDIVAGPFDREEAIVFAGEVDSGDHVGRPGTADDDGRFAIDHPVPKRSRVLVPPVFGPEYIAVDSLGEGIVR